MDGSNNMQVRTISTHVVSRNRGGAVPTLAALAARAALLSPTAVPVPVPQEPSTLDPQAQLEADFKCMGSPLGMMVMSPARAAEMACVCCGDGAGGGGSGSGSASGSQGEARGNGSGVGARVRLVGPGRSEAWGTVGHAAALRDACECGRGSWGAWARGCEPGAAVGRYAAMFVALQRGRTKFRAEGVRLDLLPEDEPEATESQPQPQSDSVQAQAMNSNQTTSSSGSTGSSKTTETSVSKGMEGGYCRCSCCCCCYPRLAKWCCVGQPGAIFLDMTGLCSLVTNSTVLSIIESVSSIQVLRLDQSQIGDAGVSALCSCSFSTHLISMSLVDCSNITNDSVMSLSKLPSLTELSLAGCTQITDEAITHFSSTCTTIKRLDLSHCLKLTQESAKHLGTISSLIYLSLGWIMTLGDGLNLLGKRCSHLQTLNLCGSGIKDVTLAKLLEQLPELNYLDISWCNNLFQNEKLLKSFGAIHTLHLSGTKINDQLLQKILSSTPALQYLSLNQCPSLLGDDIKTVLLQAKQLKEVEILFSISEASAKKLCKDPSPAFHLTVSPLPERLFTQKSHKALTQQTPPVKSTPTQQTASNTTPTTSQQGAKVPPSTKPTTTNASTASPKTTKKPTTTNGTRKPFLRRLF
ncbi:hypothetical protein Pelo_2794 [Pelomyxa schiedti]|nr:hypothetical protein Pelo_2794 [Pelomyxa schiedti]